jgi:hypothetical protein
MDQIIACLKAAQDTPSALQTAQKLLLMTIQLHGLDSARTLKRHVQLALLYSELKDPVNSLKHMLSARYLVEFLTGGVVGAMVGGIGGGYIEKGSTASEAPMKMGSGGHPEITSIYSLMAGLCFEVSDKIN